MNCETITAIPFSRILTELCSYNSWLKQNHLTWNSPQDLGFKTSHKNITDFTLFSLAFRSVAYPLLSSNS